MDERCPEGGTVTNTERTRLVYRDGRYRDAATLTGPTR
jgi:hypothetical protein